MIANKETYFPSIRFENMTKRFWVFILALCFAMIPLCSSAEARVMQYLKGNANLSSTATNAQKDCGI
jgi:hypothetical protein